MVRASEWFVGETETAVDHDRAFDGATLAREAVVDLDALFGDGAHDAAPFDANLTLGEASVGGCEIAGASQLVACEIGRAHV